MVDVEEEPEQRGLTHWSGMNAVKFCALLDAWDGLTEVARHFAPIQRRLNICYSSARSHSWTIAELQRSSHPIACASEFDRLMVLVKFVSYATERSVTSKLGRRCDTY